MNAFVQHLADHYSYQVSQDEHTLTLTATQQTKALRITPISQQNLLECQGPEAAKFLQGQLTCDVQNVSAEQSQFGAHCTPKGRALSSFRLALLNDETYLIGCHHSVEEIILKQLGKYIVFSKATLAAPNQAWACIGVEGDTAESTLSAIGFKPEQHTSRHGSALCIQLDFAQNRYEIWAPTEQAIALWDELAKEADLAPSKQWDLALIESGIAQVQQATSDGFVPQMLNFDAIDAISFTKGCYTGQEIVARTKYRGQVKRRLIRARVELTANSSLAQVGDTILLGEKDVGSVVMAASESDTRYQLLGVVKDSAMESTDLAVAASKITTDTTPIADNKNTEIQNLQIITLPYAIPK